MTATITVDTTADEPPYEQVRRQLAAQVSSGELAPGEKLPTVRQLAVDLDLAANTVARAYRELEADGVIATHGRRGTFVHSTSLDESTAREVGDAAATFAKQARVRGLSLAEAKRLVEDGWAST